MRIEQLTFTRFIAAISIVIFHFGSGSFLFNNSFLSFIFRQANVGVSYFFILSGFVMIIAYHQKETIPFFTYIKSRLLRIYPIYFVAILLLVGTTVLSGKLLPDFFLCLFMLQAWIPGKALIINFPSWSLSVELFFYIMFPLLFNYFYKKISLKVIAAVVITFWFLSQVLFYFTVQQPIISLFEYAPKDLCYHPVMHLNQFLIGNLAGLYFVRYYKDVKKDYTFHIILTLALILFALKFPFRIAYDSGLLAILFVPLIFFIALCKGKVTAFFNKKPFVFLGEISYGIYIYQWPVWALVSDYKLNKYLDLHKETDFTTSFLLRLSLLLLLSALSYQFFEAPLRNRLKKFIK